MPGPARVLSPMTALKHQKRALRRASKEKAKARKLANARECVHHLRVALVGDDGAIRWAEVATMKDLLDVLDNISNRRAITAEQLSAALKLGYAVWMRGFLQLTDYGKTVYNMVAKAA